MAERSPSLITSISHNPLHAVLVALLFLSVLGFGANSYYVIRNTEWDESRLLAGHCYLELARIEEARGREGLARKYYWQFLKRYDSPVEALRPLVEEARAAYERLGGT